MSIWTLDSAAELSLSTWRPISYVYCTSIPIVDSLFTHVLTASNSKFIHFSPFCLRSYRKLICQWTWIIGSRVEAYTRSSWNGNEWRQQKNLETLFLWSQWSIFYTLWERDMNESLIKKNVFVKCHQCAHEIVRFLRKSFRCDFVCICVSSQLNCIEEHGGTR